MLAVGELRVMATMLEWRPVSNSLARLRAEKQAFPSSSCVFPVNQPALTTWLCEAINLVLAGHAPTKPRPAGIPIERGSFAAEGDWV